MDKIPAPLHSLVLYKNQPARVVSATGKKIEIDAGGGQLLKVRPKDVILLHDGPLESLANLQSVDGDVETAWELLAGQETTLESLAELAYEIFTPATAWSAWMLVTDGLYFSGSPEHIEVHSAEQVAEIKRQREAKAAEQAAWQGFINRLTEGRYEEEDKRYLLEVKALANGERDSSRIMRELGRSETDENAQALLLEVGYWNENTNPYPARAGLPLASPEIRLQALPEDERLDLTHLDSLAIDDSGSSDPDDALSWDNGRLWVHIADVAALIPPDSPADLEARARAANLYLPEATVPMLPESATAALGLGLQEISPALSFGIDLDAAGEVSNLEIVTSMVRVSRLTYEEAETQLDKAPLRQLAEIARAQEKRRRAAGSIEIDLPEVKVRVIDGQVVIRPLAKLVSRDLVREAMLLAGTAVGRYCLENNLDIPFTSQEAPQEELSEVKNLSEMFALRKLMKPSQQSLTPLPHSGLGLDIYVQATSPLRRYLDLVVHQQLRSHLAGLETLDGQALMQRVGAAQAISREVRRTERLANSHWTLVYLIQNPGWHGKGIIIEKYGRRDKLLIPDLNLETQIYLGKDLPLDSAVELELVDVNLPRLATNFRQLES